jgi:formate dehydrogenase iron-sulfur subunit
MIAKAMLIDTVRCIGCRGCQVACKQWNGRKAEKTTFFGGPGYQNPADLSADTWTLITYNELPVRDRIDWVFGKKQCMHCLEPACASACPVAALEKLPEGPVVYHKHRCIGCRYCMLACPFEIPRFEYDSANPYITKCTMCADRIQAGGVPACSKVCPTGAVAFGEREASIREARRRISAAPSEYVPTIYGLEEAGGTSVLHISNVPFEKLGYRTDIPKEPVNKNTRIAMEAIPVVMLGLAVVLGGIYKLRTRIVTEDAPEPTTGR